MSGKGNWCAFAPMESFWHSLKVEETHGRGFETREEAKRCVFGYTEGFYNTTRMHSSINWQSRVRFYVRLTQNDSTRLPQQVPRSKTTSFLIGSLAHNHLRSMSAELSPKQAPRISQ